MHEMLPTFVSKLSWWVYIPWVKKMARSLFLLVGGGGVGVWTNVKPGKKNKGKGNGAGLA